jgi:hypothetical protein
MNPIMLRWTVLTSIGLFAGIGAALTLQRPIEALVGMILVTPVVTLLVGALMGASQWLESRRHFEHARRWLAATAIGLGIGLTVGVVAVELVGQAVLGRPVRLLNLDPLAQSANMFIVGAVAGGILGSAQLLWFRGLTWRWVTVSALGLGSGLFLGAGLANVLVGAINTAAGVSVLAISAGALLGLSTSQILMRCPTPRSG